MHEKRGGTVGASALDCVAPPVAVSGAALARALWRLRQRGSASTLTAADRAAVPRRRPRRYLAGARHGVQRAGWETGSTWTAGARLARVRDGGGRCLAPVNSRLPCADCSARGRVPVRFSAASDPALPGHLGTPARTRHAGVASLLCLHDLVQATPR